MTTLTMQVNYSYRVKVTHGQKPLLNQILGNVRFVWNSLHAVVTSIKKTTGKYPTKTERTNILKTIIRENVFLRATPSQSLQQVKMAYDKALDSFFKQPAHGLPRYKSKHKHTDSARVTGRGSIHVEVFGKNGILTLPHPHGGFKLRLRFRVSRPLPGDVSSYTIKHTADDKYYVVFTGKVTRELEAVEPIHTLTGGDVGLQTLLTLRSSDGTIEDIPVLGSLRKAQGKLSMEQARLARKQKGGKNYEKQRIRVARTYAEIRDKRQDYIRKTALRLVCENQTLSLETLSVRGIQKSHGYSVTDACLRGLFDWIKYCAACKVSGREVKQVSMWYPSTKLCSCCGYKLEGSIPLEYRAWVCPACGRLLDRDGNAAVNLLIAGSLGTRELIDLPLRARLSGKVTNGKTSKAYHPGKLSSINPESPRLVLGEGFNVRAPSFANLIGCCLQLPSIIASLLSLIVESLSAIAWTISICLVCQCSLTIVGQ